jgi:hypothetical protein
MTSMPQSPLEPSLFIATANTVYHYSQLTSKTLFECDNTDSIRNIRVSKDNSGLFAVADSQVVVLYDASRSTTKKYNLRSGDASYRVSVAKRCLTSWLEYIPPPTFLTRLAHSVLYHNSGSFCPSVLNLDRRIAPAATATPLAAKRDRHFQWWQRTTFGIAHATIGIHTRQA